jgi:hypothetical protein
MSWYNPFSWFGGDTDKAIVSQAGHDVLLLAQMRADYQAGICSEADYQALRQIFLNVHGRAALDSFDASAPPVPAGATVAQIKDAIEIGELDFTGLEQAMRVAEDSAGEKVDEIYDNAVKEAVEEAVSNPLTVIPAWVKWAAVAAVILFALSTLARLGVRVRTRGRGTCFPC